MMDNSTEWITVSGLGAGNRKEVRGVQVTHLPSPADLPSALRVSVFDDKNGKTYVIEMKYLTALESLKDMVVGEDSTFFIGKNSKRIYKIEQHIDTKADHQRSSWNLMLNATKNHMKEFQKSLSEGNANVIRRVLESRQKEIEPMLAP